MSIKIGIIGGTFDPIHYGHLILAEHIRSEAGLDKVVFMPAMVPPHKQDTVVSDSSHRFNMAVLAVSTNPSFSVSDIEIASGEISYTIRTMEKLSVIYGDSAELFFLTGADTIFDVEKWHQSQMLLQKYSFIIGSRPGYFDEELNRHISYLNEKYGARIYRKEIPEVDISSTNIRNRIREGRSIKYLTPESVEKYIIDNRLYI